MFAKLFAESGLSLERLRTLLEVGAAGSIVKAAGGDPVRQSQYSRQLKELEDYFRTTLVERQGRHIRLTSTGKELARISRFFMLGLSNFQRGCLSEEQVFRLGAPASLIGRFLTPFLAGAGVKSRYVTETIRCEEAERRLHDLTLDFAIVSRPELSRPLQTRVLVQWTLQLWLPRSLRMSVVAARRALEEGKLPLAFAHSEFEDLQISTGFPVIPRLRCQSFAEARSALGTGQMGAWLPDYLMSRADRNTFMRVPVTRVERSRCAYYLAWNPRLLRLNPHASRERDFLTAQLSKAMAAATPH